MCNTSRRQAWTSSERRAIALGAMRERRKTAGCTGYTRRIDWWEECAIRGETGVGQGTSIRASCDCGHVSRKSGDDLYERGVSGAGYGITVKENCMVRSVALLKESEQYLDILCWI